MADGSVIEAKMNTWAEFYRTEDWWSTWFGAVLIPGADDDGHRP